MVVQYLKVKIQNVQYDVSIIYSSFTFTEMFTKNKLHDPYALPNYQYVSLTLSNGNTLGTAIGRGKIKLLRNSAHGHA